MSKEKLTDEQIIKAYEHCCLGRSCVGCPLEDELGVEQCQQMRRNILNLINRLKEENAELKAENERLTDKLGKVLLTVNMDDFHKAEEIDKARKETASEILEQVKFLVEERNGADLEDLSVDGTILEEILVELAKQFGVEVEE